ncbi:PD40 domain-containing protein [candidate division KSB1 bacterium]|nr:PD40 domain-containing protein [candidate division KSB1 bacterium]
MILLKKNTHTIPVYSSPPSLWRQFLCVALLALSLVTPGASQGTRLLRQPTVSARHVAFIYGGDLWIADLTGGDARRLTSTPAVESHPHFSPDGRWIAFTSNRSGVEAVYIVSTDGGTPIRLSWYPAPSTVCGWTPDGKRILYASQRETAPVSYNRLWTVDALGGPSDLVPAPFATRGSFSTDGKQIVIDRVRRWDTEWRGYRGGQNTPLVILDLENLSEKLLPNERTIDTHPVWLNDKIYFLSDRDWTTNIWCYSPESGTLKQMTNFKTTDVRWLTAGPELLAFEREGYLHVLDPLKNELRRLEITLRGDFPWTETRWENVSDQIRSASLSPSGKRAIMEARGEIFTVPVEHGDTRNLTCSPHAADRSPLWSPKGDIVAWFSDSGGKGYELLIAAQDGLSEPRRISIGESKMAWEPAWSPDGTYIAFVDDDVRIRIVNVTSEKIITIDEGGTNLERGSLGLTWSFDSKWLAYAPTAPNHLHHIKVWSVEDKKTHKLTDSLADAFAPAWDRDGKHLYFLASTDLALGSGWANTSAMQAEPGYGAYVLVLRKDDVSPFKLRSDEEPDSTGNKSEDKKDKSDVKDNDKDKEKDKKDKDKEEKTPEVVQIDFEKLDHRTIALPMPVRRYAFMLSGPKGSVFIAERQENGGDQILQKFSLEKRKAEEFIRGGRISISMDGKKMLLRTGGKWRVVDTAEPPGDKGNFLKVKLYMHLDRLAEWRQIFNEAWRYQRDYFYDPNMHGRNWDEVLERYEPLVPFIRHRSDLNYILDQMNGELSVGHSFVFGGDFPAVDTLRVGLLGADLAAENGYWRIKRIYTAESWNPNLKAPLALPGLKIDEGDYLVGINGIQLTAAENPYKLLDGTADRHTVLHINKDPKFEGATQEIVEPRMSEDDLRQRAWVEDNRRRVEKLSKGRLAYVWVPNTGGQGVVSFNRYLFAQQDKEGAVIDERFNGGGLLDDYMVDLMNRKLRAAITNETPNGTPFRLPAGILGPKVLLINELAGSGGDFFPWVFRQQNIGPLIGTRTWGGLVKSSVHYALVDGGALTAPDNAVFDPAKNVWIAENDGVPPDIEVHIDAASTAKGRDPQLERAVKEAMLLLEKYGTPKVSPPPFPTPAVPSKGK